MYSEKDFLMVKSFGQHLSKTTAHDLSGCFGVTELFNFSTVSLLSMELNYYAVFKKKILRSFKRRYI